jgi:hypothetical protein
LNKDFLNNSGNWGGDFCVDFVGRNLDQGFVDGDRVADFF